MKIKIRKSCFDASTQYIAGQTLTVSDTVGDRLIAKGIARKMVSPLTSGFISVDVASTTDFASANETRVTEAPPPAKAVKKVAKPEKVIGKNDVNTSAADAENKKSVPTA